MNVNTTTPTADLTLSGVTCPGAANYTSMFRVDPACVSPLLVLFFFGSFPAARPATNRFNASASYVSLPRILRQAANSLGKCASVHLLSSDPKLRQTVMEMGFCVGPSILSKPQPSRGFTFVCAPECKSIHLRARLCGALGLV